jgi:hypothetical protein
MDGQSRLFVRGQNHVGIGCSIVLHHQCLAGAEHGSLFLVCYAKFAMHTNDNMQNNPNIHNYNLPLHPVFDILHLLPVENCHHRSWNHSSKFLAVPSTPSGRLHPLRRHYTHQRRSLRLPLLLHLQHIPSSSVQALQFVQRLRIEIRSPLSLGGELHREEESRRILLFFGVGHHLVRVRFGRVFVGS